jgi:hypothetical protein
MLRLFLLAKNMNQEKKRNKKNHFTKKVILVLFLPNQVRTFYNFSGKMSRVFDKISKIF